MKKIIYLCSALFAISLLSCNSQTPKVKLGDKVQKEVTLPNGEKLTKWVEVSSVGLYDKNGNRIYFNMDGLGETKIEYNSSGQEIKSVTRLKSSFSDSEKEYRQAFKYDSHGNLIYEKEDSVEINGSATPEVLRENWYEYDNNGNKIHSKNSGLFGNDEEWFEYDDKGNETYYKTSYGIERWNKYDDKGNKIYSKNSKGEEEWSEYDSKGNKTHLKKSSGFEEWSEYDDKGNKIYSKNSKGKENWHEYDMNGNIIRYYTSEGASIWYENEYYGNGKLKAQYCYTLAD